MSVSSRCWCLLDERHVRIVRQLKVLGNYFLYINETSKYFLKDVWNSIADATQNGLFTVSGGRVRGKADTKYIPPHRRKGKTLHRTNIDYVKVVLDSMIRKTGESDKIRRASVYWSSSAVMPLTGDRTILCSLRNLSCVRNLTSVRCRYDRGPF